MARSLIRLYPKAWRERYGEEFEALLEDSSPGAPETFDLLRGAVKMQLSVPTFPKLAVGLSIAGLLAGLSVSFLVTPRYVSRAEMQYIGAYTDPGKTAVNRDLTEYFVQNQQQILSRTALSRIIQDPRLDLYPEERARIPLEDVIEKMRRDIRIVLQEPKVTGRHYLGFEIDFAYRDRIKAQQTVQAFMTLLEDANLYTQRAAAVAKRHRTYDQVDRMEARIAALEKKLGMPPAATEQVNELAAEERGVNLDVLDPPSLPMQMEYPDRARFMATGFGAGLIGAVLIAVFRRKSPPIPFPAQLA
jgi:uncharacterized protein involved in exopolysaccharide biosynthesis